MAVRLTRESVQVAITQPANVRLSRLSTQVAITQPANVRLSRLSVQVAVTGSTDPVIRGLRRAGVIHHRQPNSIPRT